MKATTRRKAKRPAPSPLVGALEELSRWAGRTARAISNRERLNERQGRNRSVLRPSDSDQLRASARALTEELQRTYDGLLEPERGPTAADEEDADE